MEAAEIGVLSQAEQFQAGGPCGAHGGATWSVATVGLTGQTGRTGRTGRTSTDQRTTSILDGSPHRNPTRYVRSSYCPAKESNCLYLSLAPCARALSRDLDRISAALAAFYERDERQFICNVCNSHFAVDPPSRTMTSTSFATVPRAFLSPIPPHTHRVLSSTRCPYNDFDIIFRPFRPHFSAPSHPTRTVCYHLRRPVQ